MSVTDSHTKSIFSQNVSIWLGDPRWDRCDGHRWRFPNRFWQKGAESPLNTLIHQKPASFNGSLFHATTETTTFQVSWDYHPPFQKKKISKIYKYTFWRNVYLLTRSGWGEKGEIMKFCHPLSTDGPRGHSQCRRAEKEARADVRAGGMKSTLIRLAFLRRCAWAEDGLLTCHRGWSVEWEKVSRYHQGNYESKHKNERLPNCAKGGETGLKMLNWRKEKVVNSKKLKKN